MHRLDKFCTHLGIVCQVSEQTVCSGGAGIHSIYILASIGDRMVATSSGKKNCPTPQDVKLTIAYPNTGLGAVVSYVEVAVAQVHFLNQTSAKYGTSFRFGYRARALDMATSLMVESGSAISLSLLRFRTLITSSTSRKSSAINATD